jgi:beta-1,4-N-acetylglucosaminyltransferase
MKIAVICSHGGHLTQMLYMVRALNCHEVVFVTYEGVRTNELNYPKVLFPNFGEKLSRVFFNLPKILGFFIQEKPDVIISNGSEIAVPFFYIAKVLGIRTIFIESFVRIDMPTGTGRLIYPISDLFLVQWEDLLESYGKKAKYWGGIFDVVENEMVQNPRKEEHILVTVGMHYQGFERLIKKMDEIAHNSGIKVVMQIGNSSYIPKNADYFTFTGYRNMNELMQRSKVVVCQGAMTAIDCLLHNIPVVAVPRLQELGEVINDHQVVFAKKLENLGLSVCVDNLDQLEQALIDAAHGKRGGLTVNTDFICRINSWITDGI